MSTNVIPENPAGSALSPRIGISVCIAAYNGERFIEQQIASILQQLSSADEIIVIDDASQDRTADCVVAFQDARIRLFRHQSNIGVLASFEDAIRRSRGEIIFLSDQDDIWYPNKVETIIKAFGSFPDVGLVASDAKVIGSDGSELNPSYYADRGKFSSKFLNNLWRCKYLGCTMAFRSTLLPQILPFPRRFSVYHDIWIGMRHILAGGKCLYISHPLVYYRRHPANISRRLPFTRRLKVRIHLIFALAFYTLRGRFSKTPFSWAGEQQNPEETQISGDFVSQGAALSERDVQVEH